MKKTIFFLAILMVAGILFTMQSCVKDDTTPPKDFVAAMPASPSPGNEAVFAYTGPTQKVNLTWSGTATNAILWDVYFGKSAHPPKVASNVSTNSYQASVTSGGTYYWQVITMDANNVESVSPVWSFVANSNPAAASTPVPANNATNVSCTAAMSWTATDPEDDELTYDIIMDKNTSPSAVYKSGLTDASFTITTALSANTAYYWKIIAHDPYGGTSVSPVWKFTTGALPVNTYVGNYDCDEPAEAYNYDVAFSFVDPTHIQIDNYWNSGWVVKFNMDLTNLTFSFPYTTFQTGWTGTEAGYLDPATGTMVGTYTIWHNGAVAEQGVHTYTKK